MVELFYILSNSQIVDSIEKNCNNQLNQKENWTKIGNCTVFEGNNLPISYFDG